jgi:hypothetical protein
VVTPRLEFGVREGKGSGGEGLGPRLWPGEDGGVGLWVT